MSRSLPGRPSAEHLRNEARRLQRACRGGQASAIRLLRAHLPRLAGRPRDGKGWHTGITLQETQFTLARDYGFESWPKMMAFVEEQASSAFDSIKKILELARAVAARRGDRQVGSAHLLLAMAGEEMRPVAGPLLEGLGVTPEEVRRAAESSVSSGSYGSPSRESSNTPRMRPGAPAIVTYSASTSFSACSRIGMQWRHSYCPRACATRPRRSGSPADPQVEYRRSKGDAMPALDIADCIQFEAAIRHFEEAKSSRGHEAS